MKTRNKIIVWTLVGVLTFVMGIYITLVVIFNKERANEFVVQQQRLETLRNKPGERVDESAFANFDLTSNDLRLNEVQVLATHNSFKRSPNMLMNKPLYILSKRTQNGFYEYPSITGQFDKGIRGVEIDITSYDGKFVVIHNPITDWRTNGIDFALALEEIKIWSDLNSGHFPINIMLQIRNSWSPYNHKYGAFKSEDMLRLDNLLEEIFGADGIIKPNDIIGENDTLRLAVENDGWPLISDCYGKFYFSLLFDDEQNKQSYVDIDATFRTQKAFIYAKLGELCDYSAIILADSPFKAGQRELVEKNYLLRTRIDEQFDFTEERWLESIALGSNVLATDHMEGHILPTDYICKLTPDNKTIIARGSLLLP